MGEVGMGVGEGWWIWGVGEGMEEGEVGGVGEGLEWWDREGERVGKVVR